MHLQACRLVGKAVLLGRGGALWRPHSENQLLKRGAPGMGRPGLQGATLDPSSQQPEDLNSQSH